MLVTRLVEYALALVVLLALAAVAWRLRDRRTSALLAVGCLVAAVALAVAGNGWATRRVLPDGVLYRTAQYSIDLSTTGVYGPGGQIRCAGASALQHSGEWPLRQVGYVSWIWPSGTA